MPKVNLEQRAKACEQLREILAPGSTVYTVLKHVSSSGMSRRISLYALAPDRDGKPEMRNIDWLYARATGDRQSKVDGAIVISGCGMDMGFALVYNLGYALWPNGTDAPHGTRNGEPDTAGGYALKHRWA
jgi:hypothetical protein